MALRWLLGSSLITQVSSHGSEMTVNKVAPSVACPKDFDECAKKSKDVTVTVTRKEGLRKNIGFQMPLHYPRYSKGDYEKMEDWKLDMLLNEYGLSFEGTLDEKRAFAMGAFLWPDQL